MSLSFFIENLKCGGCEAFIERKLMAFPAIRSVEIDAEAGEVKIDTSMPGERQIYINELARLGYPEVGDNSFLRQARSYVSCAIGKATS